MGDLQAAIDSYPVWKAFLWCFYPISALVAIELVVRIFNNDDDDLGGGKMIPAYQVSRH